MAHFARRESTNFDHKDLGAMKGLFYPSLDPAWLFYGAKDSSTLSLPMSNKSKGLAQFRSIPYASIPARFRQSQMLNTISENFDTRPHRDFTAFGYGCPQVDQNKAPKGGPLGPEAVRRYDKWSCLNLDITCPIKALEGNDDGPLLPVMVYVHGGGFVEGAGNISLSHDMSRMVALSVAEGMPVIGVTIGYRMNWHGLLTCQDLIDEAKETHSNDPLFNYGLHDQRTAFQWINRFIAGFGGDPTNVTVFGESAGAASLSLHATADIPLFRRAIFESGTPHTMVTQPKEFYEAQYHNLLQYLGIKAESAKERLQSLREVPADSLVKAIQDLNFALFYPYVGTEAGFWKDPRAVTRKTEAELISQNKWLESIVIGDCTYEGYLLSGLMKHPNHHTFVKYFKQVLGHANAEKLLSYYDIETDGRMDQNLFWTNAMVLLGDIWFSQPIDEIAKGLRCSANPKRSIYRYTLGLSNPFPGSAFSYVPGHHFVDLLYIFMTFRERMPKHRNSFFAQQAEELARKWIQFANGREPWTRYDEAGTLMVCDDRAGCTVRTKAEDEQISKSDVWGERRYKGWEIITQAFDDAVDCSSLQNKSRAEAIQDLRRQLLDLSVYGTNDE